MCGVGACVWHACVGYARGAWLSSWLIPEEERFYQEESQVPRAYPTHACQLELTMDFCRLGVHEAFLRSPADLWLARYDPRMRILRVKLLHVSHAEVSRPRICCSIFPHSRRAHSSVVLLFLVQSCVRVGLAENISRRRPCEPLLFTCISSWLRARSSTRV